MSSRLLSVDFNDFTGGLVTKYPASSLDYNQSPDLDNIVLLEKGFKKRLGDSAFCAAMNSGANVQGIGYYKPVSATEYLVSICGNKIYKSDALDGAMDDITGAVTIGAGQNNIWTHNILKDLSIWVGGAPNAPIKWSGSGNAAALGGSPPSGNFAFSMRDRLFIGNTAANPNRVQWCILANPEDWSGTGSGNNDVVTNDGDVLTGGIPLNNNVAILFKNYSIYQLVVEASPFPWKPLMIGIGCCGKNAMVNVEGLVYFITNEPRMKATDGYSIQSFPDTIDDIWDGINRANLPYIQGIYYNKLKQIRWYVANGTATKNDTCIIWDLNHKCWLRETTGTDVNVACIVSGNRLMGGAYNGIIYEKDKASTYNDASETTPGAINAYWYTPWMDFGDSVAAKQVRFIDIGFKTQTSGGKINYSFGYDYNKDTTSSYFSQLAKGGKWDIDTWDDTFIWGGITDSNKTIYLYGRGNLFQFRLQNNGVGEQMQINGFSLAVKKSGKKEKVAQ